MQMCNTWSNCQSKSSRRPECDDGMYSSSSICGWIAVLAEFAKPQNKQTVSIQPEINKFYNFLIQNHKRVTILF